MMHIEAMKEDACCCRRFFHLPKFGILTNKIYNLELENIQLHSLAQIPKHFDGRSPHSILVQLRHAGSPRRRHFNFAHIE